MNETNVSNLSKNTSDGISDDMSGGLLTKLADEIDDLSPQLRKAARYVIDNPNDVSVSSIREISEAADVTPNTFMRMARSLGFDGYDDFRQPFRDDIKRGSTAFPDRARWLQSLSQEGKLGSLYADMANAAISNLEETFSNIDAEDLKQAADAIWSARQVFTLGVGIHNSNARNFTYLAGTGMVQFHAIPSAGTTATDDLTWADKRDVLVAITSHPYRQEVIDAVQVAKEQGVTIVGISDSPSSPVALAADYSFCVSSDTPQFFPSSVSIVALLETLLSFVVARSSAKIVDRVEAFHKRRRDLGLYCDE